jgi:hypothetical protein
VIRTEEAASSVRGFRLVALGLLMMMLVGLGASAAGAQEKDPFDPLLSESSGAATTAPTGGTVIDPAPAEQPPPAPAPAEQLPATGADPSSFVVVALALVCAGVGVMVVARSFGPEAAPTASKASAPRSRAHSSRGGAAPSPGRLY